MHACLHVGACICVPATCTQTGLLRLECLSLWPFSLPASGQALLHSCLLQKQVMLQTNFTSCLQVALIVVMAQIGSFVPARYASIRLVDKVFTRIGCQDSIEDNSSSFLVRAVGCTS